MQTQQPKSGYKTVRTFFGKKIEIPETWEWTKVENHFKLKSGSTPSRSHPEYYDGTIPWVSSGELDYNIITDTKEHVNFIAVSKTKLRMYPKRTFLIAITGLEAKGTRGRCAILGVEATTNQSCLAFYESPTVDTFFFFYYYQCHGEKIIFSLAQGTKQQSLNIDLVKSIKFPLPSIQEQQKIASILSNIDFLIHQTQKIIKQTQNLKKGLLQRLLTRGIGHTKFKKVELGKPFLKTTIPEEWRLDSFKRILMVQYNQVKLIDSQKYVRIIVKRRHEGIILRDEVCGKQILTDNQFRSNTGEFIISRRQIIHNACGIIPKQFDGAVVSNEYSLFTGTDHLDINYFDYFSQTDLFHKTIILTTHGVHLEKYIFLLDEWLNLKMPLPSINEQKKIVKSIRLVEQKLEKNLQLEIDLQTLKKGLMQKLLTGQIRVKV